MVGHRVLEDEYEPVLAALRSFEEADPAYSAQVCVRVDGRVVVDAWAGPVLGADSVICVYSVSKGLTGLCIGALVDRGLLDLDAPVAHYWPEFAAEGKSAITVADALSHRAGLPIVAGVDDADLFDEPRLVAALAAARPLWHVAAGFGYHPVTVGAIAGELSRRVAGVGIPEFFEREVRAPHDLEAWFRVPEQIEHRVAPVTLPVWPRVANPAPMLADVIARPLFEGGFARIANTRSGHTAGMPAASAVASARGLAGAYACALGALDDRPRLFGERTARRMAQIRSDGADLTTGTVLRFGTLFMVPWPQRPFAGWRAFGHDGAADALAFADPDAGLAFGYTTDRPDGEGLRRPDALARTALTIATRRA